MDENIEKYDKKKALIIGQIISLVGCLMLGVMVALRTPINNLLAQNKAAVIVMMPPLMVAGLGTGVLYSLPMALIGDVTIVEKLKEVKIRPQHILGFNFFK